MRHMTEKPLVSAIVPIYNTEKYLKKCVDSILNQTYQNLEIWLVDDGSTDQSAAMCDRYADMDPRVQVIHKENGGLSDARNVALDRMHGEFVAFVDSDDWIAENWIEELVTACVTLDADIAVGRVCVFSFGRYSYTPFVTSKNVLEPPEQMIAYICTTDLRPYACNKIYRSNLFDTIRFPYGRIYEDTFVAPVLLGSSRRTAITDQCVYYVRVREGSITHQPFSDKRLQDSQQSNKEMLKYYKAFYPELENLATRNYINQMFSVLKEIIQSDDFHIYDAQIISIEEIINVQIQRLPQCRGGDYDYKLLDEIFVYQKDRPRFIKKLRRVKKVDRVKSILRRIMN